MKVQHDTVRGQTEQHVQNMFLKFSLNQAKYLGHEPASKNTYILKL